jgi:hypothetical protein
MTRQNPILPKNQGSKFYKCNFSTLRALIVGQNPFTQRKNPLNRGDTRSLPTPRNNREMDELVTTNHLFSQHPPRKTLALLPISQPNCDFLNQYRGPRGAGGSADASAESAISITSHGNFSKWAPWRSRHEYSLK